MTVADDASAAAALERSRLYPSTPDERERLLRAYEACRAMAGDLWREPLGDTAPLLLPIDG
jgi:hypothetical protein